MKCDVLIKKEQYYGSVPQIIMKQYIILSQQCHELGIEFK
jgi:hypothetical protein